MGVSTHRFPSDHVAAGKGSLARLPFIGPLPGDIPDDEALIRVSFHFRPFVDCRPWTALSFIIPLSATMYNLSERVQDACDTAISMHEPTLQEFYKEGKDFAGKASIQDADGVDVFANRTSAKRFRMGAVRDLFTTAELKSKQCVVSIRVDMIVIDKPVGGATTKSIGSPEKALMRKNTFPLRPVRPSSDRGYEHDEMVKAVLHTHAGPCVGDHCCDAVLEVPARKVGSLTIGAVDQALPFNPYEAYGARPIAHEDSNLPELPSLTFNDYVSTANFGVANFIKAKDQRIELAIRLVNKIPERVGLHLENYHLPADVVMSVKHCSGQKKLICDKLMDALYHLGVAQNTPFAFTSALFVENEDTMPDWDFHLWILPQFGSSQKMFRFEGGLATYMDIAMVSMGNMKMYMEAHIVPMAREERTAVMMMTPRRELRMSGNATEEQKVAAIMADINRREAEDRAALERITEALQIRAARELERSRPKERQLDRSRLESAEEDSSISSISGSGSGHEELDWVLTDH
ncbi:hypothetical protein Slin15195_G062640 [Septoria linicola]|uniref:Uncharacterized protein n=1 Tax=Septoria linicola TaxID=215465 RepID=A0A9Q9AUU6_9PEZI|nr:hypothetical protein Slin15195_G062640 [Septoria linicola]